MSHCLGTYRGPPGQETAEQKRTQGETIGNQVQVPGEVQRDAERSQRGPMTAPATNYQVSATPVDFSRPFPHQQHLIMMIVDGEMLPQQQTSHPI